MKDCPIALELRNYIASEILEGQDDGLDNETPLIEWGVINSIEISKLIVRIHRDYKVRIEPREIHPENFKNIIAISSLVRAKQRASEAA